MFKSRGFTAVEVVLVVVVVAALGFAGWTWWNVQQIQDKVTNTSNPTQQEKEQKEENDVPEDWHQYQNSELGYTFRYPADWSVDDDLNKHEERYGGVTLRSASYQAEKQAIGGTRPVKGAVVFLSKTIEFTENDLTKTFKGLTAHLHEQGSIQPDHITVNGKSGIEYEFAYEGVQNLEVEFFISDNQYVSSSFSTKGKEKEHRHYETYKKILETVEVQ